MCIRDRFVNQYPQLLLEINDPPPYLYAKGNLALLNQPSIAIVGSRNASVQGEKNAEAFAEGLCPVSYTHLDVYKRQIK